MHVALHKHGGLAYEPCALPEPAVTLHLAGVTMPGTPLPVPDGTGIYGFPNDLLSSLDSWQRQLATLRATGAERIIELVAPLSETSYLIEARVPAGRPVLAIEPHHDDLILSAGGYFLSQPRPLTVITVFTRSNSVHPDLSDRYESLHQISALRAEESHQAFIPLQAEQHVLELKDADPPYAAHDPAAVERLSDTLRPLIEQHPDAELIAPAGVTRHPDHLLVHEVARQLGCRWFWDDTSFYPTYAANVDDRLLFEQRTSGRLTLGIEDITGCALDKLTLLHMYQSQMQPLREMYRVLRYNWTVAAGTGDFLFAERFFRSGDGR